MNVFIYLFIWELRPFPFVHTMILIVFNLLTTNVYFAFHWIFDIIFHLHYFLGAITTELDEHKVLRTLSFLLFFLFVCIVYRTALNCMICTECSIQKKNSTFWTLCHQRSFVISKCERIIRGLFLFCLYLKFDVTFHCLFIISKKKLRG